MIKIQYILAGNLKEEKRYQQFLEKIPQAYFQQSLEWRNVINSFKTDKSVIIAVLENSQIIAAIPLYIFPGKYGKIITSIPYPGPLGGVVSLKKNQFVFKTLMQAVDKLALQENCSLATIISSPFWPDDDLYRKYFCPHFELENYTLSLDLIKPKPLTSHFKNNLKRMLKKSSEKGLVIEQSTKQVDLNKWYLVYKKRAELIGIEQLPKKLFDSFLQFVIPQKGGFWVVKDKGEVTAGCLIGYHKLVVDAYLYFGTNEAYKNGAIYFLINHLIEWAKKEGFRYFNFQSSKPRRSGPYNFKMQWGAKEFPYYFFTKVYGSKDHFKEIKFERIKVEYKYHYFLPTHFFDN